MVGNPIGFHVVESPNRATAPRVLAFSGCATPPAWSFSRPFVACPTCGLVRRGRKKAAATGGYLVVTVPPHREAYCNLLEFRAIILSFSTLSSTN